MKTLLKTAILFMALFATIQVNAQTVVSTSSSLEEIYEKVASANSSAISTVNLLDRSYQDSYIQNFSYYNNPEIRKLESEVSQLGSLYRRDQYRKENYTADKYSNLTDKEKKEIRNSANGYRYAYNLAKDDDERNKTLEQKAEEYFSKIISPYMNGDRSINKQKLYDDIKKKLNSLFEMKENEKQKEVTKLENQLRQLQNTLSERKKNKQQIIDQRMNELVGLPNTLRW